MSSSPTYYDFFGVRQSASFEEIRSAYLWLMKQHHPDRSDHSDRQRSADFAAMVNRSYAVLKDPQTRARYDAWLAREAGQVENTKVRRALLTGETRRRRETKWDASSKAATALAGMIVLLVAAVVWIPEASFQNSQTLAAGVEYDSGSIAAGIADADVRREVRSAMTATPRQAELASQRCFASARDRQSVADTQACIIFDDAFLEWNRTASDLLSRSVYFDDSVVRLRHRDALAALGTFEDARIDQLKQTAVNALLAEIKSQVTPGANIVVALPDVANRDEMSQSGTQSTEIHSSGLTTN
jgi:hypothetical protein